MGLGVDCTKPRKRTLLQDFENFSTNDDLIQGLKGLILDIFELKVNYL